MGVRNPFRMTVDDTTGTLYFGDVGPNVFPELEIDPLGYDEINAAPKAGNFGWPLFIGPNEPYPVYDFDKNKVVATFRPDAPENHSPNNTGIKKLPSAQPALIWYGNLKSKHFPSLGTGGRSIMAGPVYHYDPKSQSSVRLPKELDGYLFIYEWMRNWIQVSKLGSVGPEVKPFLPDWNFRRPVDMKLGADGALAPLAAAAPPDDDGVAVAGGGVGDRLVRRRHEGRGGVAAGAGVRRTGVGRRRNA